MVFWNYEPSRPIKTTGGIKTRSQRGAFGTSWWARQWIESLEKHSNASRLQRGRSYARNGQVISLDIQKGKVAAQVQGSRRTPYKISIGIKMFSEDQWSQIMDALVKNPYYSAKLLTQQMPEDIEAVMKPFKLSLFPDKKSDLDVDCSCPDWEVPCKHLAAVYYILGEALDDNPFFLFLLRGMEKEDFLAALTQLTMIESPPGIPESPISEDPSAPPDAPVLPINVRQFWEGKPLPAGWLPNTPLPAASAIHLKRLGSFPFWQGEQDMLETLTPVYQALSPLES